MEHIASSSVALLIFLCIVCEISCHLCLISPSQRGSMTGLNKKGSDDCSLLNGPCGDRPRGNGLILRVGQNFTVTFQKNLDHWTKATPGKFQISLEEEKSEKSKPLAVVQDRGEPSLHLYSVNVTIPNFMLKQPIVMQVVYITNNPKAPKEFFQCSDVQIQM